jgi:tellurite resistance protein
MYTAVAILLVLIVLTPTVTLGVLYLQYRSWPPFLWKDRVIRWVESFRHQREQLRREGGAEDEVATLFEDHFDRYLRAIPLEALDECPGIGPATVARLRDAGYRSLGAITKARFESIQGIGPTRATALRDAVRTLVRQARSRFEAGACPEAQEFRRQADALRAAERKRHEERVRTLAAIDVALREIEQLHDVARGITFWTYLFHRDEPGVSETVMHRPLPTVVVAPPPALPVAQVVAIPPPVRVAAQVVTARPAPQPAVSPPMPVASRTPTTLPTPSANPVASSPSVPVISAPVPPQTAELTAGVAHPWLPRLRAFARFAFVVAKSDGRIAQSERKVIRSFLAAKFGHHEVLARHIDPLMEQVEATIPTEAEAVAELRTMTTAIERQELYRFAEQIADAAGERKPREREALERIALAFGITVTSPTPTPVPPQSSELALPRVVPTPERSPDPRALLEIPPGAELTPGLIRRRFMLLSDKIDPAKAREMGPEFARMAEEKLAKLRSAAEGLIASFNEPLEKPDAPPPPADPRYNPDLDDVFGG